MDTHHAEFFKRVDEAARFVESKIQERPQIAVALTGGVGAFVDGFEDRRELSFSDVPHFASARAEGHAGTLVFGRLFGVPLVALCGRFHYYEGHHPAQVIVPAALMGTLGVHTLINTNAVGGIREDFEPGDIMLITDHINMMGMNPLVGLATQREEDQFTNMIDAYDPALAEIARSAAAGCGITLKEGVFAAVSGPTYETRAEVRALRTLGADAVGMSTVPEVVTARFVGMKVLALSIIANAAADRHGGEMSHKEVLASVGAAAPKLSRLLMAIVGELSKGS